jgi:hypothetical protein
VGDHNDEGDERDGADLGGDREGVQVDTAITAINQDKTAVAETDPGTAELSQDPTQRAGHPQVIHPNLPQTTTSPKLNAQNRVITSTHLTPIATAFNYCCSYQLPQIHKHLHHDYQCVQPA